ncbi:MAG: hypothetical protein J6330_06980 [Clostridia bacterium]|nr:hypothetical protein [Clostridia bacterium]
MTNFPDPRYEAAKLFMYQIVMAVFGLVTVMATSSSVPLMIVCAVLGIGLYVFLIYNQMWELAAKDRIRADAGRYEYNAFKPLLLALAAGIPNIVFGTLCVLGAIPGRVTESISQVGATVCKLILGHFLGTVKLLNMLENPFVWLFIAAFCVFVPVLGYNAGYRGLTLFPKLHTSKKDKE